LNIYTPEIPILVKPVELVGKQSAITTDLAIHWQKLQLEFVFVATISSTHHVQVEWYAYLYELILHQRPRLYTDALFTSPVTRNRGVQQNLFGHRHYDCLKVTDGGIRLTIEPFVSRGKT
jgi:hypothetical protein